MQVWVLRYIVHVDGDDPNQPCHERDIDLPHASLVPRSSKVKNCESEAKEQLADADAR